MDPFPVLLHDITFLFDCNHVVRSRSYLHVDSNWLFELATRRYRFLSFFIRSFSLSE